MPPKKKSKNTEPETTGDLDFDALIGEVCSGLKLPPTNLQRGSLVRDALSTGSLALDLILGGGIPAGMVIVPFGKEQSGKSTILYHACKTAVNNGIYTMFFDWEGATDADRVEKMGLKIDWSQEAAEGKPVLFRYMNSMRHGEQMFSAMKRILDKLPDKYEGPPQMIFFLDSMPAVVPKAVDEDDENAQAARLAAMYSEQLPRIKSRIAAKRCVLLVTNQLRENPRNMFGKSEYEPCGNAPKYYSDVRLKVKPTVHPLGDSKSYVVEEPGWTGEGVDRYTFAEITTTKNKSFSANRKTHLRLWFEENGQVGRGIDPVWDVFEYLRMTEQVKRGRRKEKSTTESCLIFDKGFYPDHLLWHEFKEIIMDPKNKGTELDFLARCRDQINSREAFDMYFEKLSGVKSNTAGRTEDPDDEDLPTSLEGAE